MSLYDMINDISAKQGEKTETGDTRIMGVVLGVVTQNFDDKVKGRVCVKIPTRDAEANTLLWARVVQPSSGKTWGHYFLPEVGDQVLLAFEGGNIERPYVIGSVPKDDSGLISKYGEKDNLNKALVTTSGSRITFSDKENAEIIDIATAKDSFSVKLENEAKKITILDKENKQHVIIDGQTGKIMVQAQNNCVIKAGDNTSITLNGQSGAITIRADRINLEAQQGLKIKSEASLAIEGASVGVKSQAKLDLSAGGVAKLAGSIVNLG